jgi:uncharacterized protein (DUF1778 family)
MTTAVAKRETLNIRIKPGDRGLIDEAARLAGKTRTNFVLEATRRAAEEALMDHTHIAVSEAVHAAFLARLDAAPAPNARLARTMRTTPPWE